jgi:hypothetical protein
MLVIKKHVVVPSIFQNTRYRYILCLPAGEFLRRVIKLGLIMWEEHKS